MQVTVDSTPAAGMEGSAGVPSVGDTGGHLRWLTLPRSTEGMSGVQVCEVRDGLPGQPAGSVPVQPPRTSPHSFVHLARGMATAWVGGSLLHLT